MRVAVFGLGKLGLPLAALLASKGHRVIGVDPSENARKAAQGIALWAEPELAEMLARHRARIEVTSVAADAVAKSTLAMVIVPTPSDETGGFSNDLVIAAVRAIGAALARVRKPYDVVVVSTVMPGSTAGPIREELERASRRQVGAELGLLYSPQFIALGSVVANMRSPELVLIGEQPGQSKPGRRLATLLGSVQSRSARRQVHRLPWAGAELAKLSVNAFITAKIAFANWVAQMAEGHGTDPAAVLAAVGADPRIGSRTFSFGMPFGGPCFPRDNRAIALASDGLGLSAALPCATETLNQEWREGVFRRVAAHAAGGKVAILGLAYKSGTAVTEESAGLHLARGLAASGHEVVVHDPLVVQRELPQAKSVKDAVRGARVVAITTPAYTRVSVGSTAIVVNPWAIPVSRSSRFQLDDG